MVIRKHLDVYGMVQGVGFRYRAKRMADGSVELEVQGDDGLIEEYIDRLCHSSYISVSKVNCSRREVISEDSFVILDYY